MSEPLKKRRNRPLLECMPMTCYYWAMPYWTFHTGDGLPIASVAIWPEHTPGWLALSGSDTLPITGYRFGDTGLLPFVPWKVRERSFPTPAAGRAVSETFLGQTKLHKVTSALCYEGRSGLGLRCRTIKW